MKRTNRISAGPVSLGLALILAACSSVETATHPSELTFEPITYRPPSPLDHRHELGNGMVVYVQEDHYLPTLQMSALIRTGSLYDPADKVGLASMTGSVMRSGGTTSIPADDLDERLAFLGGSISTSIRGTSGGADLFVLAKDMQEGLELFADVLMHPAFDPEKIDLYKDQAVAGIRSRNDSPSRILRREFDRLLYGDHPLVWEETEASIAAIGREDLLAFHDRYYSPNNVILTVAGDFETGEMLARIERAFAAWRPKAIDFPPVPEVRAEKLPGVFMVQKDTNQGYVTVGHFGIKDTNPDRFAIDVMNFILGGGSFTSRITTKVRSDEGLAYNTGSRFANRHLFPGTFQGYVQTKSSTVHYAISLILAEFERIRGEPVGDEEMETARSYYLDSFPDRFSSAASSMGSFARLEYDGFPMDHYDTFREKIEAVTKEDVQRVARRYIRPDEMSIFVVGDIEACRAGSEKHAGKLDDLGAVTVIDVESPAHRGGG